MKQERGGRVNRANSLIQQIVAEELLKNSDSILNSLTVSYVDTSLDMKKAIVYVTSLNNEHQKTLYSLSINRLKIQKSVSSQLEMKFTPKIMFEIDPLLKNVEKINQLLNNIKDE